MANAQRSVWSSWVVLVLSMFLSVIGSGSRYLSLVQNFDSPHRMTRLQDFMKLLTSMFRRDS